MPFQPHGGSISQENTCARAIKRTIPTQHSIVGGSLVRTAALDAHMWSEVVLLQRERLNTIQLHHFGATCEVK